MVEQLDALSAEIARVVTLTAPTIDGPTIDWDAPVPTCAPWTLRELVSHLGGVHRMVVQAVRTGQSSHSSEHWPAPGTELSAWLQTGGWELVSTLSVAPGTAAWSFAPGGGTVGWWRGRQLLETVVHRVDVEVALGEPSEVDAAVAVRGITEVVDVLVPLLVDEGALALPGALTLRASDTGDVWTLGHGESLGCVQAEAADLFLGLWKRRSLSASAFSGQAESILALPLTP